MDRLQAMSMFVATVEAGSFSAASRKLGVPLPTLSRRIADLEAHLDARLLNRSTRKLSLTDTGVTYADACKRILEQVADAETAASGEYSAPRGELVITAPIVFGRLHVLPVVSDFLARFPEINVRMLLADRNMDLVVDHIDLALRIGALPDSSMVATRVGSVRRVICGSPDYFASHGTPTRPDDLAGLTCVTFFGVSSALSWAFVSRRQRLQPFAPPRSRLSVNTAEAAIDAAIAGVGITRVFSYQVARAVNDGKLMIVLKDFEPDPIPVSLIYPGREPLPLKMRSFLDFAVPELRKSLTAE